MNLQKRLITSFFIMLLVPICLAVIAFNGFMLFYEKNVENKYNIEVTDSDLWGSSASMLNKYSESLYRELLEVLNNDPEKFSDKDFLQSINYRLELRDSYLLVREGNVITFSGTAFDIGRLEEHLPASGDNTNAVDSEVSYYIGEDHEALIRKIDFTNSRVARGSVFLVTQSKDFSPEFKDLVIQVLGSIIAILLFTSLFLTWWIYKGILTPIQKLTEATQNIKDGNLDFALENESNDEIGVLFDNFEEMRSRLKSSAEEKLQNDRENKELIGNISHDLKTPITAVKGYVEGIMDGVADTPEKMEKYIRTIYNKANEMDALINELTFYCKIDTNRIPYNFNKINVAGYFEDCVEELSLDLESRNIDLEYNNKADRSVNIIADSEQLSRVVNNIIGNSAKYIDKEKGQIKIRIKDVGDFIQVEIEDNGKGIAKKDIPYIFDRFYRTDASRNSSQGGSGIGLSIVKKIIEDHGGKIWASSTEGVGTTMYFVLRKYQEVPVNE